MEDRRVIERRIIDRAVNLFRNMSGNSPKDTRFTTAHYAQALKAEFRTPGPVLASETCTKHLEAMTSVESAGSCLWRLLPLEGDSVESDINEAATLPFLQVEDGTKIRYVEHPCGCKHARDQHALLVGKCDKCACSCFSSDDTPVESDINLPDARASAIERARAGILRILPSSGWLSLESLARELSSEVVPDAMTAGSLCADGLAFPKSAVRTKLDNTIVAIVGCALYALVVEGKILRLQVCPAMFGLADGRPPGGHS